MSPRPGPCGDHLPTCQNTSSWYWEKLYSDYMYNAIQWIHYLKMSNLSIPKVFCPDSVSVHRTQNYMSCAITQIDQKTDRSKTKSMSHEQYCHIHDITKIITSGQSFDKKAALPLHMDGSMVITRWCKCASHLIHASLGPPKSTTQTASRSVQPFLHSSQKCRWVCLGMSFPLKIAICKSFAPCSRQITMPAPNHSNFYRPDALPDAQPTVSK